MKTTRRLAMLASAALILSACGGGGAGLVPSMPEASTAAGPEQIWIFGGPSCSSVSCTFEQHYERFRRIGDCAGLGAAEWCSARWPDSGIRRDL